MHRVESASLSMEANDLEQVLGTLRQQALELEARYSDQVGLRRIHLSLCQTPPHGPHLRSDHVQSSCARHCYQQRFYASFQASALSRRR